MNKSNEVEFDFVIWAWYGIADDIRDVWEKRFGEDLVNFTLNSLREWLKTRPDFEKTIEEKYGGNWVYFIWNCLERNENWRKENEYERDNGS